MNAMKEIKEKLCDELSEINRKGDFSIGDLDAIDKLTHSIKSIDTIIAMDSSQYSRDYYDGNRQSYGRTKRGRYSMDSHEETIEMLREAMSATSDEHTKSRIKSLVRELENA